MLTKPAAANSSSTSAMASMESPVWPAMTSMARWHMRDRSGSSNGECSLIAQLLDRLCYPAGVAPRGSLLSLYFPYLLHFVDCATEPTSLTAPTSDASHAAHSSSLAGSSACPKSASQ